MRFNRVSNQYEDIAVTQNRAAQKLLSLSNISNQTRVLDLGCGPGNLSHLIAHWTLDKS